MKSTIAIILMFLFATVYCTMNETTDAPEPIVCGPNSEPSDCANICTPTCAHRRGPPACRSLRCSHGCKCTGGDGFVFRTSDHSDGCVRESDCPNDPTESTLQCGENEQIYPCGACDSQCGQPARKCTRECRSPECGCLHGYRRNAAGSCVLEANCDDDE